MNLLAWLTDPRIQLGGTLAVVLVSGYLYLENVMDRMDLLLVQSKSAQALEVKDDADWKGEETRTLQNLEREHMELRRMILEYCKE